MSTNAIPTRGIINPMATEWYCRIMNEVVGPLSSGQLLDRVRTGQVKQDTLIRKDDSQWVPANQVGGLFEAADHTTTRRLCPYCGHNVSRPPTTCEGCGRSLVMSVNSRLVSAGAAQRKGKPVNRAEQAERLRERADRQELVKYCLLFVVWVVLLFLAPYLIYLATEGRLVFDTKLGALSVICVSAFVGAIYLAISRFA